MDRSKPALLNPGAQPHSPEALGCGAVMGPQEEPTSGTRAIQRCWAEVGQGQTHLATQ